MFHGGTGNDSLAGGVGDDVLDGGPGIDLISYASATVGVTVDLGDPDEFQDTGEGIDQLISIEDVRGSEFSDDLTGSAAANRLMGGQGGDILFGAGGADALWGRLSGWRSWRHSWRAARGRTCSSAGPARTS